MDIAEHSMCQPGNPSPHGLGHFIRRPGPAAFQSAKSAGWRLRGSVSRSRCPSRSLSSVLPRELAVVRERRDVEVDAARRPRRRRGPCSMSVSVIAIISGMCSVALG